MAQRLRAQAEALGHFDRQMQALWVSVEMATGSEEAEEGMERTGGVELTPGREGVAVSSTWVRATDVSASVDGDSRIQESSAERRGAGKPCSAAAALLSGYEAVEAVRAVQQRARELTSATAQQYTDTAVGRPRVMTLRELDALASPTPPESSDDGAEGANEGPLLSAWK